MGLKLYKQKRDLKKSPEPAAKVTKKHKKLVFVVQKHAATHLHYDFRLEVDGVLKSWAVPKGPSLNPKDKRLAVQVEDHPYDYRHFEGIIPEGYGAGTVMIWDEGSYIPLDENHQPASESQMKQGFHKGILSFALNGQKLKGVFTMVKLKNPKGGKENWLLIKNQDEYASTKDITKQDESVVTHRNLEEIGENKKIKKKAAIKIPKTPEKRMPHHISPMLAKLIDKPFDSSEWLFEIKWDGFRAIAELNNEQVALYSRNLKSFHAKFPTIVKALKELKMQAIFDGEIVIFDEKGKPDFQSLQNYQGVGGDLFYYVFDLLYYNGHDLRNLPLIERKELLQKVLETTEHSPIQLSEHILTKGKALFAVAKKQNLEGIIAKECISPYYSKRSSAWLKIKTHARQEAIICGFTAPRKSRTEFGALIIGIFKNKKIQYAGHVGGGFDRKSLKEVMAKLKPLITNKCPFKDVPKTNAPVTWVQPKILCEVEFAEWTKEGIMRQPIFQGLREDKNPQEVEHERPISLKIKKEKEDFLTNLDKVFWPEEGYTKGDLIDYYRQIAPYILPYLKNRPESLRRYPNGIGKPGFFQKNIDNQVPNWIEKVPIAQEGRKINYMMIQDEKSLLYAINLACIDLNPFNSRKESLNNPDYLVLDLDPEDISFEYVIKTAQTIHKLLDELKIPNFCKTSGARGMHIYVPVGAKYTFDQVKQFAEILATICHNQIPEFTSLERMPKNRQKKVYIDYLQNNFGQTMAAPYSVRPKPGALVSTPLSWTEVKKGLNPKQFTFETIFKRLKKKDPFLGIFGKGIDIQKCLKKIESMGLK